MLPVVAGLMLLGGATVAHGVTLDGTQDLNDGPAIATDGGTKNFDDTDDAAPYEYHIDSDAAVNSFDTPYVDLDLGAFNLENSGGSADVTINALSITNNGGVINFTGGSDITLNTSADNGNIDLPSISTVNGGSTRHAIALNAGGGDVTVQGDVDAHNSGRNFNRDIGVDISAANVDIGGSVRTSVERVPGSISVNAGGHIAIGGDADSHVGQAANSYNAKPVTLIASNGVTVGGNILSHATTGGNWSDAGNVNVDAGAGPVNVGGCIDAYGGQFPGTVAIQGASVTIDGTNGLGQSISTFAAATDRSLT